MGGGDLCWVQLAGVDQQRAAFEAELQSVVLHSPRGEKTFVVKVTAQFSVSSSGITFEKTNLCP